MAKMTLVTFAPTLTTNTIANISPGNARITSFRRSRYKSTLPPKNPPVSPITAPSDVPMPTAISATNSDVRPP